MGIPIDFTLVIRVPRWHQRFGRSVKGTFMVKSWDQSENQKIFAPEKLPVRIKNNVTLKKGQPIPHDY